MNVITSSREAKPHLPDECLVDNRVYTDQRTFDAERERLFNRVWNFACHESEIREPGDYLTTVVAGQPIIVSRNADGELRAFFNTCRHRAAQVVRDQRGTTRTFTCFYHLWSYDLNGSLVGVPEAEAYKTSYCPAGLDREAMGLVPLRAQSVHGLVFVCLDDRAPSLAEFLGEDFSRELRLPFGSPDLRVSIEWSDTLRANWKMEPENSRDGYHATLLHKRLRGVSTPGKFRLYENGHAIQRLGLDYESGLKAGTVDGILAERPELAQRFLSYPLPGATREAPSTIITIFPDVLIAVRYSALLIVKQLPIGPEETLFETRFGSLKDDTDEIRDIRRKHWHMYWGRNTGNLPEDWEAWEAQQAGVKSAAVRYSILARGERADEGLRGDDNRVRSFWEQWRRYMNAASNSPPEG